jgi:phage terminase large subunit-like protein
VAYAFSAEEPERLRGPQFEAAWADEFCIWPGADGFDERRRGAANTRAVSE